MRTSQCARHPHAHAARQKNTITRVQKRQKNQTFVDIAVLTPIQYFPTVIWILPVSIPGKRNQDVGKIPKSMSCGVESNACIKMKYGNLRMPSLTEDFQSLTWTSGKQRHEHYMNLHPHMGIHAYSPSEHYMDLKIHPAWYCQTKFEYAYSAAAAAVTDTCWSSLLH